MQNFIDIVGMILLVFFYYHGN